MLQTQMHEWHSLATICPPHTNVFYRCVWTPFPQPCVLGSPSAVRTHMFPIASAAVVPFPDSAGLEKQS